MKKILLPLSVGILFVTLQSTLLSSPILQRIRPDIVLILIVIYALSLSPILGSILSLFLGYLMDLFSGNTFGLFTLSRPMVFYMAKIIKDRFFLENFQSMFFFTFSIGLIEGLLLLIFLRALNPGPHSHLYPLFYTCLLPQSFFTGVLALILIPLFHKRLFLSYQQGRG